MVDGSERAGAEKAAMGRERRGVWAAEKEVVCARQIGAKLLGWGAPQQEGARAIGSGSAGLFKTDGPQPTEKPAFPQLANALYYQAIQGSLSPATRAALDQANSPQEWNTFLLAAPESMRR